MTRLFAIATATVLATGLAACSAPAEDSDTDMGADVATVDGATSDVVGDASDAPGMETLQLALDEACPTVRARISTATCDAAMLGQSFDCTYAFGQDGDGVEREITLTQEDGGWTVESEPRFCDSLNRANAVAEMNGDAITGEMTDSQSQ